jgi:hypothetical protein
VRIDFFLSLASLITIYYNLRYFSKFHQL